MGFASDACWILLLKSLLIKNNKKREAALKNEAGGDEKHVFFLLGPIKTITKFSKVIDYQQPDLSINWTVAHVILVIGQYAPFCARCCGALC